MLPQAVAEVQRELRVLFLASRAAPPIPALAAAASAEHPTPDRAPSTQRTESRNTPPPQPGDHQRQATHPSRQTGAHRARASPPRPAHAPAHDPDPEPPPLTSPAASCSPLNNSSVPRPPDTLLPFLAPFGPSPERSSEEYFEVAAMSPEPEKWARPIVNGPSRIPRPHPGPRHFAKEKDRAAEVTCPPETSLFAQAYDPKPPLSHRPSCGHSPALTGPE